MQNIFQSILTLISLRAATQNLEWRTGLPDTGFNLMKDRQDLKHYLFIKVIPDRLAI